LATIEQRSLVGHAGQNAKEFQTKKGPVVKFSVAEVVGYDKEKKEDVIDWVQVTVWNEGLRTIALKTIKKGNRVAITGAPSEGEYTGQKQSQISAQRIGLVDYLRPAAKTEKPPQDEGSALGW
jgi:single-stranded DNA-binding protein